MQVSWLGLPFFTTELVLSSCLDGEICRLIRLHCFYLLTLRTLRSDIPYQVYIVVDR